MFITQKRACRRFWTLIDGILGLGYVPKCSETFPRVPKLPDIRRPVRAKVGNIPQPSRVEPQLNMSTIHLSKSVKSSPAFYQTKCKKSSTSWFFFPWQSMAKTARPQRNRRVVTIVVLVMLASRPCRVSRHSWGRVHVQRSPEQVPPRHHRLPARHRRDRRRPHRVALRPPLQPRRGRAKLHDLESDDAHHQPARRSRPPRLRRVVECEVRRGCDEREQRVCHVPRYGARR